MFVDSAHRLGVDPRCWLYRDQGRIVGHMGSIAVRVKLGDEERQTGWLVDTMVLEEYRNQGVGPQADGGCARGPAVQPVSGPDSRDA